MKKFGKILTILLAISGLLIIALIVFIRSYDLDRARPWINEKVSAASGRTIVINGHLSATWARPAGAAGWASWIPWPTITAQTVGIGNPEWAKNPQFATVDSAEFTLEVLPLFNRTVIIPRIALRNPVIDIERTSDNQNNWTFKPVDSNKSPWKVQLRELAFADGVVTVIDAPTGIVMRATVTTIGQPIALGDILAQQAANQVDAQPAASGNARPPAAALMPRSAATGDDAGPYGFGVKLEGTYRDAKLSGNARIGGVLSLMDQQRPFPIQADVRLGDNHLTVLGTLTDPAKLAALDMRLTLAANSMADLYGLTGVSLPDTPKFRTSGHLTGNTDAAGSHFKYDQFTGVVGSSDLAGTLEFNSGKPRPRLSGTVTSKRLVLADLGPAIGGTVAPQTASDKAAVASGGRVLPSAAFRTERWRTMDADVQFTGASIVRNAALPISDMTTHILLDDGVVRLDPLQFGVAGGTLTGTIRLDGRQQPLDGRIDITARHLKLKQLFPTFDRMDTSFGEINGDAKLSGLGNSTAALAATANGEVKLLINNGAISNALLEEAGLNVANIVVARLFGDKTVQINCGAADFVVKDGVLNSRVFAFDTTDALINVNGTINLATEQMLLDVYPQTKGFRVFSLRSPLYVKGTFSKPDVGVMKGSLALRGAAAVALGVINPLASVLALLAPSNDEASPCPAMMATARGGLKGSPAAVQPAATVR